MRLLTTPYYLSNFIGRSQQVNELVAWVKTNRLITITGTGGIGKTRIAIEILKQVRHIFPDGIYFIDLSAVFEETHIPSAIAQSLEIEGYDIKDIARFLDNKKCLLIFDNYEQLTSATAFLVTLLESCPHVKLLITSRVVLNIEGEQVFSLPPLSFENQDNNFDNESALLFYDRVKNRDHAFQIHDDNQAVIAKIFPYLGGIPLSLELVAAHLKVLSPNQLLQRMDVVLDLPIQGSVTRQPSHRSLRETIDWSYRLLTPSEQSFFQLLAIFKNGFSLEAIEFIYTKQHDLGLNPILGLSSLTNKSLLNQKVNTEEGDKRFYFLETIHTYAFELLKTQPYYSDLEKLHAQFFVEWSEQVAPELKGGSQFIWLERLQAEVPNFRAAMRWILKNKEAQLGLRLGAALWRFWFIRSMREEGLVWFNQVMQLATTLPRNATFANALEGIGLLQAQLVSPKEGLDYLKKSLEIWLDLDKPVMSASLMNHISWLSFRFSDYEESRKYALDAYNIHFQEGNQRGMALSYCNLGWVAFLNGNFKETLDFIKKEKPLHFESGDLRNYSYALIREGWVLVLMGAYETAFDTLSKAIDNLEPLKDGQLIAFGKHVLGKLYFAQGQFEAAYESFETAEKFFKNTRDAVFIALTYCSKSQVCVAINRLEEAENLLVLAANIFEMKGENINRISESYSALGYLECEKHNYLDAAKWFKKAVQHNHKKGEHFYLVQNIEGLAKFAFYEKHTALAMKLLIFCKRFRRELQMPLSIFERKGIDTLQDQFQSNLSPIDYKMACKEGLEMILDQAVLLACSVVSTSKMENSAEKDMQFLLILQETINTRLNCEDFDTDALCKALGTSRSKLHNKIKIMTGQSTADYIRTIRLNKAKVLLETSDLSVGDIAAQVGFEDFTHFSKTFFKVFGKKPTEMRRSIKI